MDTRRPTVLLRNFISLWFAARNRLQEEMVTDGCRGVAVGGFWPIEHRIAIHRRWITGLLQAERKPQVQTESNRKCKLKQLTTFADIVPCHASLLVPV